MRSIGNVSYLYLLRASPSLTMLGIRAAILEGDIDKAFKYTTVYYPNVLKDNEQIYFRLRCRKFIEMIRRCSELDLMAQRSSNHHHHHQSTERATNGYQKSSDDDDHEADDEKEEDDDEEEAGDATDGAEEDEDDDEGADVFEHKMELDEQMRDGEEDVVSGEDHTNGDGHATANGHTSEDGDGDGMDTDDTDPATKHYHLLQETIKYGQVLRSEFRDDHRKEVKKALEETFSLLAYEDPKSSVVAHLLEPSGRAPVAEDLNSAILGISISPLFPLSPCTSFEFDR